MKNFYKTCGLMALAISIGGGLSGCQAYGRPDLEPLPISKSIMGTKQDQESFLASIEEEKKSAAGSLWQPDARSFFNDSRATKIGDILTVIVSEQAQAASEANTETTHENDSESSLSSLFRVAGEQVLPGVTNNLLTNRENEFTGEGSTDRSDSLQARIAAMITHKLPNGYLVIEGRREVLVNFEKQIMTIQGIVRPEDIGSNNTIGSDKIAEARISYAGQGIIDETQNAPYGARFLQRWLPF